MDNLLTNGHYRPTNARMAKRHDEIAAALNQSSVPFGWHGFVRCSDGNVVLLRPFLRACWEASGKQWRGSARDYLRNHEPTSCFQDRWNRMFVVLHRLAVAIDTKCPQEGSTLDDLGIYQAAQDSIRLYLDLFHFYIVPLLDAVAGSLGVILSGAPGSFPSEFKRLFGATSSLDDWQLLCGQAEFRQMLDNGLALYERFRKPASGKTVRDTIAHRLCQWQIVEDEAEVTARLHGLSKDIPKQDAIADVKAFMHSLCSFLGHLPLVAWDPPMHHRNDLIRYEGGGMPVAARFMPVHDVLLEIE